MLCVVCTSPYIVLLKSPTLLIAARAVSTIALMLNAQRRKARLRPFQRLRKTISKQSPTTHEMPQLNIPRCRS